MLTNKHAIEVPEVVNLKRARLVYEDGSSSQITQRRIYRNGEWSVETTTAFLERVHGICKQREISGKLGVKQITSSSGRTDGTEMVQLEVSDLMNRLFVLDYLSAAMISGDVVVEKDTIIKFREIGDEAKMVAEANYLALSFFSEWWMPSGTAEQAFFLQVFHQLNVEFAGPGWEVSHAGGFKHYNPKSNLPVEILRTVIRKHYANKPVLIPVKAFLMLGQYIIQPNEANYTTENH